MVLHEFPFKSLLIKNDGKYVFKCVVKNVSLVTAACLHELPPWIHPPLQSDQDIYINECVITFVHSTNQDLKKKSDIEYIFK